MKIHSSWLAVFPLVFLSILVFCEKPSEPKSASEDQPNPVVMIDRGPGVPKWIMAKAVSSNAVEVLWSGDSAVDSFGVFRSMDQLVDLDTIAQTADTSFTDRNLESGTLYTYRIRSFNENGMSPLSNEASARTPIEKPRILETTHMIPDSIRLRWGAVKGASHYRILCSWNGLAPIAVGETMDTTWTSYVLARRGLYTYQIEALDFNFESRISEAAPCTLAAGWSYFSDINVSPDTAVNISLEIEQGVPFLSFIDFACLKKASVVSLRNGFWSYVGAPGISTGRIDYVSLDVDAGIPWIAYCDYGKSFRALVARYGATGWETVGEGPGCSLGAVDFPTIAVENGLPHVGYIDYMNSKTTTVVRFNGAGWDMVGKPGFFMSKANVPIVLSFINGVPHLAGCGVYDGDDAAFVWRMGLAGWELAGQGPVSNSEANNPSLYVAGGAAYLSYTEAAAANAIVVKRYEGGVWQDLSSAGISTDAAGFSSVCAQGDTIYIAFVEPNPNAAIHRVFVKRWDGRSWQSLGCVGLTCGILYDGNPFPLIPTLSIRVFAGVPYIAFTDALNSGKAAVLRYESAP